MIRAKGLTKYFGDKPALLDLDFDIRKGERYAIFGPSGAGKTTLMRILTAYTPPTAGTVQVAGYDLSTHSLEIRKRIGYLPETVSFYANMSVGDYLNFALTLHRLNNRRQRVADVVEWVGLDDYIDTHIGKLDQALQQRLGLAQAIVHRPELLILDEPTTGLDPLPIVEMHRLIRQIGQEVTVILSTSSLTEAEQTHCTQVLLLHQGRAVAQDTPSRLAARLEGGHRIRLQASAPPPEAIEMLQSLDGVHKACRIASGVFDLHCPDGVDCRSAVANLAAEKNWGLLELETVDDSLEDVLFELTTTNLQVVQ